MMRKKAVITGLDIGSSKVAGVVAESSPDGSLKILAHASKEISGSSRGVITSLPDVSKGLLSVVSRLRMDASRDLGGVYVNIASESVKGTVSRGMVPLSVRGREVVRGDLDRVALAAGTIHVPIERDILHRIVHSYSVDDQPMIPNALGLYASRLSCEMYVITADTNQVQNIIKCVHQAGCDTKEVVFTALADGIAVLNHSEREDGCLVLDIGSQLTVAGVFASGSLQCLDVVAVGGSDMKADFKDDPAFNRMLGAVRSKIAPFTQGGRSLRTIAVVGGMSFADGFIEALEEKLSHPVKIGVVKDIRGELPGQENVRLATAIGLVKYAHEKRCQGIRDARTAAKRLTEKVVDLLNNYF